ncbi:MAG TPA: hypothetical protein VM094_02070 [Gemmatimonadales bacterium]|nr:hypothetical protein [Gemmatimonadales bacterium]
MRKTPDWVAAYPALAPLLDYAWAQYLTRNGDPRAYYNNAATIAQRLGLRVVMGVNVEDCYGLGTDACSAADLVRFGTMAVSHPASCAFIGWRYNEATWQRAEIREAWEGVLAVARGGGRRSAGGWEVGCEPIYMIIQRVRLERACRRQSEGAPGSARAVTSTSRTVNQRAHRDHLARSPTRL